MQRGDERGYVLNRARVQGRNRIVGQPESGADPDRTYAETPANQRNRTPEQLRGDANREALAAQQAATRRNNRGVLLGTVADAYINPGAPEDRALLVQLAEAMRAANTDAERATVQQQIDQVVARRTTNRPSADVVALTASGRYEITEAKGTNVEHAVEQLQATASELGPAQVDRYTIVIPGRPSGQAYTVEGGLLYVVTSSERNGVNVVTGRTQVRINGKPVNVVYGAEASNSH